MVAQLVDNDSLSTRDEQLAQLLAAGELTQAAIARQLRISDMTLWRKRQVPAMQARVRQLREEFRDRAMEDAVFADKRARVVARNSVAVDLLKQLQSSNYQTVISLTDEGEPIEGFDKERLRLLDVYLNSIAAEMEERGDKAGTAVGVVVKVYLDPRMTNPLEATWDDAPAPRSSADA